MIIYLYGADSYRRQKNIKELVNSYREKYSMLDLGHFDLSEKNREESGHQSEFLKLREFISTPSLFRDKKIAILENAFFGLSAYSVAQRNELKKFFESQLSSQNFILIISENNKPPVGFSFLISEETSPSELKFQEFEKLEGSRLKHFIKKEADEKGVNLFPKAIDFLAESFNGDNWGLVNELETLSVVKADIIDLARIKEVSDYVLAPNAGQNAYYSIMNLISNQSFSQKIRDLEILFCHQEEPAKIFNILASQTQSIKLTQKIADYDPLVKFGILDSEEVLLDLVIN
ncbi:MAG: hypothetical protein V3T98_00135 [Candidatus Paceibacterota bacterium]